MSSVLLKSPEEVRPSLKDRRLSLFLDYDGTLAPIAASPGQAALSPMTKEVLGALAELCPVAIVTGRSLADIRSLVNMDSLAYAGNHGLEVASPDFTMLFDAGQEALDEMRKLAAAFAGLEERFEGVIFEDKGLSLSLHYRLLGPGSLELFRKRFDEAASGALARGRVRLSYSKKAFEIKADVGWNKGRAVKWMLERKRFKCTLPVYIGDDETDRDAYSALGADGVSINVGSASSGSAYYLSSQAEVGTFLKLLLRPCHNMARQGYRSA